MADATAYLLERKGDVPGALALALRTLSARLASLRTALQTASLRELAAEMALLSSSSTTAKASAAPPGGGRGGGRAPQAAGGGSASPLSSSAKRFGDGGGAAGGAVGGTGGWVGGGAKGPRAGTAAWARWASKVALEGLQEVCFLERATAGCVPVCDNEPICLPPSLPERGAFEAWGLRGAFCVILGTELLTSVCVFVPSILPPVERPFGVYT